MVGKISAIAHSNFKVCFGVVSGMPSSQPRHNIDEEFIGFLARRRQANSSMYILATPVRHREAEHINTQLAIFSTWLDSELVSW